MKKLSVKKLSILGLVLFAASAVTAAILPSKAKSSSDKKLAKDGIYQASTSGANSHTCVPGGNQCHYTANSGTTGLGELDSVSGTTTVGDAS